MAPQLGSVTFYGDMNIDGASMITLQSIRKFLAEEDGPTAVEYGVMMALIVIACIGAVQSLAQATADSFDDSAAQLTSAFGS